MSTGLRTGVLTAGMLNADAATSIGERYLEAVNVTSGLKMIPTLARRGAASFSNSGHLPTIGGSKTLNPVILPSGRVIFRTRPAPTGSGPPKTIGMACVRCCNALVVAPPIAKITSGARPTNSAA